MPAWREGDVALTHRIPVGRGATVDAWRGGVPERVEPRGGVAAADLGELPVTRLGGRALCSLA